MKVESWGVERVGELERLVRVKPGSDGLDEVRMGEGLGEATVWRGAELIEAGWNGLIAGDKDEGDFGSGGIGAQGHEEAKAIEARHVDIAQNQVGPGGLRDFEAFDAVMGGECHVTGR